MKSVARILKVAALLFVFALVAAGSGWGQSEEQQSLGDVARKQKAKEGSESKGKVFTNEDLPSSPNSSASQSSATPATASEPGQGDAAAAADKEKPAGEGEEGSESKAEAAAAAQKKLDMLKADEGSYHRGIDRFEQMISSETDDSRKELYRNALQHAQQRLSENLQQQAEAQKDLDAKQAAAKEEQQSNPPPQPEQPPQ